MEKPGEMLDRNLPISSSSSPCKKTEPLDLLTGSPIFMKPKKLVKKIRKQKGSSPDSFFDHLGCENLSFTGRLSMCLDDGRESLGILPQFKNQTNLNFIESPETFLMDDGRAFLDDGRESLGILPQFKGNARQLSNDEGDEVFLVSIEERQENELDGAFDEKQSSWAEQFIRDCKAIENDTFLPVDDKDKDVTDENYSVYAEANFLASKIADNSILDISQEGTILDKTPQPELLDELDESIPPADVIIDTKTIHKQLDLLVPPSQNKPMAGDTVISGADQFSHCFKDNQTLNDNSEPVCSEISTDQTTGQNIINQVLQKGGVQTIPEIIVLLSAISNHHGCSNVRKILEYATSELVNLGELDLSNERHYKDDSGRSSAENDKHLHESNAVLDLSVKSTSSATTFAQALDLSFSKEDVPRRLSITFSHNNDPGLPEKQPSNNLKQQTMYMRPLWGSAVHSSEGSSMFSNESRASSTGSMKVKLKPKKCEQELSRRGPLKAVVPLHSNLMVEEANCTSMPAAPSAMKSGKQHKSPKPVAQSTPEDGGILRKKTMCPLASPLARPTRTTPLANRTRRITELCRSNSMDLPKQVQQKSLNRGKSATELKPAVNPSVANKAPLRRAVSAGGKENLHKSRKQVNRPGDVQTNSKLPQKNFGMKPFNLVEKLKKSK